MLMNIQDTFRTYPQNNAVTSNKDFPAGKIKGKKETVQESLAKKYGNADVFVSSKAKGTELDSAQDFQSDKEYSIILTEDEMNLLASTDPKDKKAQEKLYAQIDNAMKDAKSLGEEVQANEDLASVLQVGISVGTDGKSIYFAKTEEGDYQVDSKTNLMNMILEMLNHSQASAEGIAE